MIKMTEPAPDYEELWKEHLLEEFGDAIRKELRTQANQDEIEIEDAQENEQSNRRAAEHARLFLPAGTQIMRTSPVPIMWNRRMMEQERREEEWVTRRRAELAREELEAELEGREEATGILDDYVSDEDSDYDPESDDEASESENTEISIKDFLEESEIVEKLFDLFLQLRVNESNRDFVDRAFTLMDNCGRYFKTLKLHLDFRSLSPDIVRRLLATPPKVTTDVVVRIESLRGFLLLPDMFGKVQRIYMTCEGQHLHRILTHPKVEKGGLDDIMSRCRHIQEVHLVSFPQCQPSIAQRTYLAGTLQNPKSFKTELPAFSSFTSRLALLESQVHMPVFLHRETTFPYLNELLIQTSKTGFPKKDHRAFWEQWFSKCHSTL